MGGINEPPNGTRQDPLTVEVLREEPKVPLSLIIRVMVVGLALAIIIPIGAVLAIDRLQRDDDLRALQTIAYNNCVAIETRDTLTVTKNAAFLAVIEGFDEQPPNVLRLIEQLEIENETLEPQEEKECEGP